MKVWVCERQVAYEGGDTLGLATTAELAKAIAQREASSNISWRELKDGSFTGTDNWWNLVRACQWCNLSKGPKNGDEFIAFLSSAQ